MLTLWGPGGSDRYCDGRSRRDFLKLGGLAMGGLSLPDLLQAEARGALNRVGEVYVIGGTLWLVLRARERHLTAEFFEEALVELARICAVFDRHPNLVHGTTR